MIVSETTRLRLRAPRELFRADEQEQPAKTALFAGGKKPGLRANFFALMNLAYAQYVKDKKQAGTKQGGSEQHTHR